MQELSTEGRRIVEDVAQRHGLSADAVTVLLRALAAGHGTMAQFNHPEFGGMGQWSQGGMIMVGDMFNQSLKQRVDAVCTELARQMRNQQLFQDPSASGQHQMQGTGSGASLFVPGGGATSGNWWPDDLGQPSSTGAQNNMRYACFPDRGRLAIDVGGRVTVYDTADHQIHGFSQQQSGDASLSFTSQHGLVRVADLAIVSPVWVAAAPPSDTVFRPTQVTETVEMPPPTTGQHVPAPSFAVATAKPASEDIIGAIERLAGLKEKGILSESEFAAKKAELLGRL